VTLAQIVKKYGLSEASRLLEIPRMTLWRWVNGETKIAPVHAKFLAIKMAALKAKPAAAKKQADKR
jgi:hypothetical protein